MQRNARPRHGKRAEIRPRPRRRRDDSILADTLERIAAALERLAPRAPAAPDFAAADAFVWHPDGTRLTPVPRVNRVDMSLLKGIDRVRDMLVENTERFARGLPANNALLWGARGMGKSSLVKAVHAGVNAAQRQDGRPLKLVEIHREDIESLPELMALLRGAPYRFIVFCDDLSFDADDTSYKSLKAVLEGGIEGRPDNVDLLRHLEPPPPDAARHDGERALDRDQSGRGGRGEGLAVRPLRPVARLPPLQPGRISRDGRGLCRALPHPARRARRCAREALEWATTRGARSGRVAWQYVQDLAGRLGVPLEEPAARR